MTWDRDLISRQNIVYLEYIVTGLHLVFGLLLKQFTVPILSFLVSRHILYPLNTVQSVKRNTFSFDLHADRHRESDHKQI